MSMMTSGKTAVFVLAPEPGERIEASVARSEAAPGGGNPLQEANRPAGLDARALRATLAHAFQEEKPAQAPTKPAATPANDPPARAGIGARLWRRVSASQILKIGLGLALVIFFGWMPLQTLLVASSVEAVVNSRIVTIRSPIDGVIAAAPDEFTAWSTAKGAPALRIVDDQADRAHLDDLRLRLAELQDERPSIVRRRDLAQASLEALSQQTRQFTEGRIRQLTARVAALNHDLAAALAKSQEADAAMARADALARSGAITAAETGRLRRDKTVAAEGVAAARQRLDEASVEIDAANHGFFLGDSYNDQPDSAQRAEDMRLRVGDLSADLESRDARLQTLRADIANETKRYERRSDVTVALPASGRVWEVMTSPGEHVNRGQDLMRLLDCSTAVVTANVSESVYNRLRLGAPVVFRPSSGGPDYPGKIVNLTGAAGAPGNFAILPSLLLKETYHVTVAVPRFTDNGGCDVGRTGRVIFEKGAAEAAATPAADGGAFGLRP
jgi:multidrug resistance efflux pump